MGDSEELARLRAQHDEFVASSQEVEAELEREVKELRSQLEKETKRADQHEREATNLRNSLRDAERSAVSQQRARQEELNELTMLREEKARLETEHEILKGTNRASVYHVQDLREQLDTQTESRVLIAHDLELERQEFREREDQMHRELVALRKENFELRARIDELEETHGGGGWFCWRGKRSQRSPSHRKASSSTEAPGSVKLVGGAQPLLGHEDG